MIMYGSVVLEDLRRMSSSSHGIRTPHPQRMRGKGTTCLGHSAGSLLTLSFYPSDSMTHWHVLLPFREPLERHQQLLLPLF